MKNKIIYIPQLDCYSSINKDGDYIKKINSFIWVLVDDELEKEIIKNTRYLVNNKHSW